MAKGGGKHVPGRGYSHVVRGGRGKGCKELGKDPIHGLSVECGSEKRLESG